MKGSRQNPIEPVTVRMPRKLHCFLKAAAASQGMTLSEYILARVLGPAPVQVIGDFKVAPTEAENAAAAARTAAETGKK